MIDRKPVDYSAVVYGNVSNSSKWKATTPPVKPINLPLLNQKDNKDLPTSARIAFKRNSALHPMSPSTSLPLSPGYDNVSPSKDFSRTRSFSHSINLPLVKQDLPLNSEGVISSDIFDKSSSIHHPFHPYYTEHLTRHEMFKNRVRGNKVESDQDDCNEDSIELDDSDGLISSVLSEISRRDELKSIVQTHTSNENFDLLPFSVSENLDMSKQISLNRNPKVPARPGAVRLNNLIKDISACPSNESSLSLTALIDFISECEKELVYFESKWIFITFKHGELLSLFKNIQLPNLFHLLCTSYLLEVGIQALSVSNSPGYNPSIISELLHTVYLSTFDCKAALSKVTNISSKTKVEMYYLKRGWPYFLCNSASLELLKKKEVDLSIKRTQFILTCRAFGNIICSQGKDLIKKLFVSWKQYVSQRKLLYKITKKFVKGSKADLVTSFLLWKEWVKRKLLKRHLIEHEATVRDENDKLHESLALSEKILEETRSHEADLLQELSNLKSTWVDPKTISKENEITPKLLMLIYSKLVAEISNVVSIQSPEISKIIPNYRTDTTNLLNLKSLNTELSSLAEHGAWAMRNQVLEQISSVKAAILEEEETALKQLLVPPIAPKVEFIMMRWCNYHLSKVGCVRKLMNFKTDLCDSELFAYLMDSIAPEFPVKRVDKIVDLKLRAEEIFRVAKQLNCVPPLTIEEFITGSNTSGYVALLTMLFLSRSCLEENEWTNTIADRLEEFKTKLEKLLNQPVITSPELAIVLAETEAISNEIQHQIKRNSLRNNHMDYIRRDLQSWLFAILIKSDVSCDVIENKESSLNLSSLDSAISWSNLDKKVETESLLAFLNYNRNYLFEVFKNYSSFCLNLMTSELFLCWSSWFKFCKDATTNVSQLSFEKISGCVLSILPASRRVLSNLEVEITFEEFLLALVVLAQEVNPNGAPTALESNLKASNSLFSRELYSHEVKILFSQTIQLRELFCSFASNLSAPVSTMNYDSFLNLALKTGIFSETLSEPSLIASFNSGKIISDFSEITFPEFLVIIAISSVYRNPDPLVTLEHKLEVLLNIIVESPLFKSN